VRIVNQKLRHNVLRYLFQCSLAAVTILVALLFLDVCTHTAIVATLGASAFIVFATPGAYAAQPRSLIGGYVIGTSVGCLCHFASILPIVQAAPGGSETPLILSAAAGVSISIFLMVITGCEHPPAAGMALGLVLNEWDYTTILFVLGAVVLFTLVRSLLRPVMIDLTHM